MFFINYYFIHLRTLYLSVEKQLNSHFKLLKIPLRRKASNGIWLSFLLPLILLISAFKYNSEVSFLYWHFALLSFGFSLSSICGILHYYKKCQIPLKQIGIIVSMSTTSLLLTLYSFEGYGVYVNLFHSLVCSVCYHPLLELLLKSFKYGFTYGEASIITQILILFQTHVNVNVYFCMKQKPILNEDIALIIVELALSCILALTAVVYIIKELRSTFIFYILLSSIIVFGIIIPLHILLEGSPLFWMLKLLVQDQNTILLVIYWALCVLGAIVVITIQILSNKKASTSLRKYFHILAVAVYIPGLIVNRSLLYLASGVILGIFIVLEVLRLLSLPPLSNVLHQGFCLYVDEKDSDVALTPIYLLAGVSLPLWLHPQHLDECDLLTLMAGVLSIGIGDCFASMIGYKFGKHKWKNSQKSIEGSLACFGSQILVVLCLIYFGWISFSKLYISVFGVAIVTLIEAKTDQVDNLVLPMVQFAIFLLG